MIPSPPSKQTFYCRFSSPYFPEKMYKLIGGDPSEKNKDMKYGLQEFNPEETRKLRNYGFETGESKVFLIENATEYFFYDDTFHNYFKVYMKEKTEDESDPFVLEPYHIDHPFHYKAQSEVVGNTIRWHLHLKQYISRDEETALNQDRQKLYRNELIDTQRKQKNIKERISRRENPDFSSNAFLQDYIFNQPDVMEPIESTINLLKNTYKNLDRMNLDDTIEDKIFKTFIFLKKDEIQDSNLKEVLKNIKKYGPVQTFLRKYDSNEGYDIKKLKYFLCISYLAFNTHEGQIKSYIPKRSNKIRTRKEFEALNFITKLSEEDKTSYMKHFDDFHVLYEELMTLSRILDPRGDNDTALGVLRSDLEKVNLKEKHLMHLKDVEKYDRFPFKKVEAFMSKVAGTRKISKINRLHVAVDSLQGRTPRYESYTKSFLENVLPNTLAEFKPNDSRNVKDVETNKVIHTLTDENIKNITIRPLGSETSETKFDFRNTVKFLMDLMKQYEHMCLPSVEYNIEGGDGNKYSDDNYLNNIPEVIDKGLKTKLRWVLDYVGSEEQLINFRNKALIVRYLKDLTNYGNYFDVRPMLKIKGNELGTSSDEEDDGEEGKRSEVFQRLANQLAKS